MSFVAVRPHQRSRSSCSSSPASSPAPLATRTGIDTLLVRQGDRDFEDLIATSSDPVFAEEVENEADSVETDEADEYDNDVSPLDRRRASRVHHRHHKHHRRHHPARSTLFLVAASFSCLFLAAVALMLTGVEVPSLLSEDASSPSAVRASSRASVLEWYTNLDSTSQPTTSGWTLLGGGHSFVDPQSLNDDVTELPDRFHDHSLSLRALSLQLDRDDANRLSGFLLKNSLRVLPANQNDLVLLVHARCSDLSLVESLAATWEGGMSIILFLDDMTTVGRVLSSWINERANTRLQLVRPHRIGDMYPVNVLRNLLVDSVPINTLFVFATPNLLLSKRAYELLYKWGQQLLGTDGYEVSPDEDKEASKQRSCAKCALVIPLFEYGSNINDVRALRTSGELPRTKDRLVDSLAKRRVRRQRTVSRVVSEATKRRGKAAGGLSSSGSGKKSVDPVGYMRFVRAKTNEPWLQTAWVADFVPTMVLRKTSALPRFDEEFGGVTDKYSIASFCIELHLAGYQMYTVPDVFGIVLPVKTDRAARENEKLNAEHFRDFLGRVQTKYLN